MSEQTQSKGRGWVLPVLPLLVFTAVYVAGYFVLSDYQFVSIGESTTYGEHSREFRQPMILAVEARVAIQPLGMRARTTPLATDLREGQHRGENLAVVA